VLVIQILIRINAYASQHDLNTSVVSFYVECTIWFRRSQERPVLCQTILGAKAESPHGLARAQEHRAGSRVVVTPFFFKSTSQGAATTLLCATTVDPADGGKCFENCQATNAVEKVKQDVGQDVAVRCFDVTEKLLADLGF
jgi:hypothetical protein